MCKMIISSDMIRDHINDTGYLRSVTMTVAGLSLEWRDNRGRQLDIDFEIGLNDDLEFNCLDYIEVEKYEQLQSDYESLAYDVKDKTEEVEFLNNKIIKLEAELRGAQHRNNVNRSDINVMSDRIQDQAKTIIKYTKAKLKPWWKVW